MKTLLLYASKTGSTRHCAELIARKFDEKAIDIVDINHVKTVNLDDYDKVVIGTPIYIGKINRKMKRYVFNNQDLLVKKELHFFVCGLALGFEGINMLRKEIPEKLFKHATQVRQLGSEVHLDKLNLFYRAIMKSIMETQKPEIGLLEGEIEQFSRQLLG